MLFVSNTQAQAQVQQPGPAAGPHMLAKTVLPPCVYTCAVTGSFSGAACAASPGVVPPLTAAAGAPAEAASMVASAAPAEVVMATATSLLLLAVAPAPPAAAVAAPGPAAAVGAAAGDASGGATAAASAGASARSRATAADAAEEHEEDGEAAGAPAHEVLCEQPAFGTIVAMAAFRHPFAGRAKVRSSTARPFSS